MPAATGTTEVGRMMREGRLMDATARIQERLGGGMPGGLPGGLTMPSMSGMPSMPSPRTGTATAAPGRAPGAVTRGSAGGLAYRLYVPTTLQPGAPLLVMLHGGTQDADAFAGATGMDEAGEGGGGPLGHPQQSRAAQPEGHRDWVRPRGPAPPPARCAAAGDAARRHPGRRRVRRRDRDGRGGRAGRRPRRLPRAVAVGQRDGLLELVPPR